VRAALVDGRSVALTFDGINSSLPEGTTIAIEWRGTGTPAPPVPIAVTRSPSGDLLVSVEEFLKATSPSFKSTNPGLYPHLVVLGRDGKEIAHSSSPLVVGNDILAVARPPDAALDSSISRGEAEQRMGARIVRVTRPKATVALDIGSRADLGDGPLAIRLRNANGKEIDTDPPVAGK